MGSLNVTTLAFADDLVILSDSDRGMQENLRILDAFTEQTGLCTNPAKCQGFLMERSRAGLVMNRCEGWKLQGEKVKLIDIGDCIKYLGVHISPLKGIVTPSLPSLHSWRMYWPRSLLRGCDRRKSLYCSNSREQCGQSSVYPALLFYW